MTLRPALRPVCGRCGKPREGLRHDCRSNSSRKATVSLKFDFGKCATCKKTVTNPLTHSCKPRSDFKRRKTRAAKREKVAARKKRQAEKHDYQACADKDCPKPLCVAFRTGRRDGYQEGFDDGFGAGFASGFAEGLAACPGPHR
jgi:hypothetical protein